MPTKRVTARSLQAAETRQRLVDAAVALFSELEYEKVAVSEIVEEADVAHGLLFHYFRSKRGIYLEAMRVTADAMSKPFSSLESSDSPAVQIRTGLRAHLEYLSEHRGLAMRLVLGGRGADPQAWKVFEDARALTLLALAKLLDLDADNAALRITGRCAIAAVDEATVRWLEDEALFTVDEMVEWVAHLVANCLESAAVLDSTLYVGGAVDALRGTDVNTSD